MFNRTVLAVNNVIDGLPTNLLFSTLAVTLLLTTTSLAQAANNPALSCKNTTTPFTQKNPAAVSQNKQVKNKPQNEQQRLIGCMVTQLQQYQQPEYSARQQYLAYKAQAWLNYANYEDSINSRTAAGHYALQTGSNILAALGNGTDEQIKITADIPPTSALMRPDLWATLQALKESDGITLAPRELAFSEVALIWAATEQCEQGWRHSGAHFRMSERWLEQAREAYINAHDSKTNVALEERINQYFKQYTPLDTGEDKCQGQVLPASVQSSSENILREAPLSKVELDTKLNTQPMTKLTSTDALQIKITRTLSAVQVAPNTTLAPLMPVPSISVPIPMPVPTATYKIVQ